jgi:organic radical activating enzyme
MNDSIKILDVFYGNKCQLACAHCDTRSDYIRKGEFDPTLENILESVTLASQQFNVECWSILGGEPFLYKDTVLAIIKHIRSLEKEKDKVIFFPTNGLLLSKKQHMDLAVELITKHRVWMQICSHVAAWDVLEKHNQMLENVYKLADLVGYDKVEPTNSWWATIMNLGGGNAAWQEWI